jgi:outer membrane protein assembly factor BamB
MRKRSVRRRAARTVATAALLLLSGLSVAGAAERFDGAVEDARLVDTLPLDGELYHVQGVEVGARRIWVTSVDGSARRGYLHEFDRTSGRLLRRVELTDGARYHPGGLSLHDGTLWVPVAELRPNSSAVLLELDAATLRVRRRLRVADHLGCVAVAPDGRLVAGNWDSRLLYVIDPANPVSLRVVPNPSTTHYQDMKFVGGALVAGGNLDLWSGTVDFLDWPSLALRRTLRAGAVGPVRPFGRGGPYTGEGMAMQGRDLYLLPEDGPSRLFHFRLAA